MDFLGIGPIAELAKKILDMFPNAEQRAQAASKLQDFALAVVSQQNEINKVEAASTSLFVAGWRPACGWLCVGALAYNTVIAPMFHLGVGQTETLIGILTGILGLGGLRTFEKVKGTK